MMTVFICPSCGKTRLLAGKRSAVCPACRAAMANCTVHYDDWVRLTQAKRSRLIGLIRRADPADLILSRPVPVCESAD